MDLYATLSCKYPEIIKRLFGLQCKLFLLGISSDDTQVRKGLSVIGSETREKEDFTIRKFREI